MQQIYVTRGRTWQSNWLVNKRYVGTMCPDSSFGKAYTNKHQRSGRACAPGFAKNITIFQFFRFSSPEHCLDGQLAPHHAFHMMWLTNYDRPCCDGLMSMPAVFSLASLHVHSFHMSSFTDDGREKCFSGASTPCMYAVRIRRTSENHCLSELVRATAILKPLATLRESAQPTPPCRMA
jgi:hypothetical protein